MADYPDQDQDQGITAYHAGPREIDKFSPSGFRGSTFFAGSPNRALSGAGAGMSEMIMDTATDPYRGPMHIHKVSINPEDIYGLHYTPEEKRAFETLPETIRGDDALEDFVSKHPLFKGTGISWDDVYDPVKVGDRLYEYHKKSRPPSITYEQAIRTGRDVYGQRHSHYGPSADEKSAARSVLSKGMKGYLVQDEAGLSIAMADPSSAKIHSVSRKADGGSVDDQDQGITAYHGSPHEFDQFDISKIGTGEGAQAYGQGLYFSEKEPVAKGYRDKLVEGTYRTSTGEIFDPYKNLEHMNVRNAAYKNIDNALDRAQGLLESQPENAAMINRDIQKLILAKEDQATPHKGHMYEVRINAHPDHFLDWDRPLAEQPYIMKAIDQHIGDPEIVMDQLFGHQDATGRDLHERFGGEHKPQAVSQRLSDMGIKGIKYFDQGSRGAGEGSRNYVVFDDKLVTTKRRYERGGAVYGNMDMHPGHRM